MRRRYRNTVSLKDRQDSSNAYWQKRNEDEYSRHCAQCRRGNIDTDLMTISEFRRFIADRLCIYCQHPPLDRLPAWVQPTRDWSGRKAAKKRRVGVDSFEVGDDAGDDSGGDYDGSDSEKDIDYENVDEELEVVDAEAAAENERLADADAVEL